MIRKIIHIDEDKCNGCGLCARACHEGAIDIVDGKARLMRENFCDGFGDCLPNCPMGAITFEEREAPDYDAAAVAAAKKAKEVSAGSGGQHSCPGSRMRSFMRPAAGQAADRATFGRAAGQAGSGSTAGHVVSGRASDQAGSGRPTDQAVSRMAAGTAYARPMSQLRQWPVQIRLLPAEAPFFDGAKLLIAADCTAYAYAGMHEDFIKGRVTLVGCPKLDPVDYTEKLTEIISRNNIKSVTIVRMEVPCCGGLQRAAENALRQSGKFIPWRVVTISCEGEIIDEE